MRKHPVYTAAKCSDPLPKNLKDSPHLVGEFKEDGSHYLLYIGFDPYERRQGNTLLSTHESVVDRMLCDRSDNVPHITKQAYPALWGTVIDGEIVSTNVRKTSGIMNSQPEKAIETQNRIGLNQYRVWDVLAYKGEDVRSKPLSERRKLLEIVVAEMNNEHVTCITQIKGDLEQYFQLVVDQGGEGIVVKDLRKPYGQGCTKLKKSYTISLVMLWTNPGSSVQSLGSVSAGVYEKGRLHEVARIHSFPSSLFKDVIVNFDNKYRGHVVDVFAQEIQEISKKSPCGKLRHATYDKFREDVHPATCTSEKMWADLKQAKAHINRGRKQYVKHKYRQNEGQRGSAEQWSKIAASIAARLNGADQDLQALGLTRMPTDLQSLSSARKTAIKKVHPDLGGSHDEAARINQAFEKLKKMFG